MAAPVAAAASGGSSAASSAGTQIAGSAISSGIDTGGNLIANLIMTAVQQGNTDRANHRAIQLANSAHQREVADLKKAGLNPILSATGGSGAQSPSQLVPNVNIPDIKPGERFMNTMSNLQNISNSKADVIQKTEATKNLAEQTNTEITRQEANSAQAAASRASANLTDTMTAGQIQENIKKIEDTKISSAAAKRALIDNQIAQLQLNKEQVKKGLWDLVPINKAHETISNVKHNIKDTGPKIKRVGGKVYKWQASKPDPIGDAARRSFNSLKSHFDNRNSAR